MPKIMLNNVNYSAPTLGGGVTIDQFNELANSVNTINNDLANKYGGKTFNEATHNMEVNYEDSTNYFHLDFVLKDASRIRLVFSTVGCQFTKYNADSSVKFTKELYWDA